MFFVEYILRMIRRHPFEIALAVIALALFFAQSWSLPWVANPNYDEAIHVEAARAILEGWLPFRDFAYAHPPLLIYLVALVLKTTGSMEWVRFLYLALNILTVFPLYFVFRKISGNAFAAFLGSVMYLTFFELVQPHFRILELRPVAHWFFAIFLYISVVRPRMRKGTLLQSLCAILSVFTFFPMAANLALASLAIIFSAPRERWREKLKRYALIGVGTAVCVTVFLLLWPEALRQTILEHLEAGRMGTLDRLSQTFEENTTDGFLYIWGTFSLIAAMTIYRGPRAIWSAAMLGMIAFIFVPAEFYPRYTIVAAFAFPFGFVMLTKMILDALRKIPVAGYLLAAQLLTYHLYKELPALWPHWTENKHAGYQEILRTIRTLPEPMLSFMEPGYVVDAGKRMVHHYFRAASRYTIVTGDQIPENEYLRLGDLACTIVLSKWDQDVIPGTVKEIWEKQYTNTPSGSDVLIYRTNRPGCPS